MIDIKDNIKHNMTRSIRNELESCLLLESDGLLWHSTDHIIWESVWYAHHHRVQWELL